MLTIFYHQVNQSNAVSPDLLKVIQNCDLLLFHFN
jgi:hypothetical protein